MLILVLINVQCLQNVAFNFEEGLNSLNHFSPDSHHPIKTFHPAKFLIFTLPLDAIRKTLPRKLFNAVLQIRVFQLAGNWKADL